MATKEKTSDVKIAKAKVAFTRQSPRKVRRTANLLRNMTAGEAVQQLEFSPYAAAPAILKLLKSAMANASHNLEVENPEDLKISQLLVDENLTYKRWRAMSKGRAYSIMKRSSKISVALSEMNPAEYAKYVWDNSPRNRKNSKKADSKKTETKKPEAKKETAKKTETKTSTAKKPAAKKTTAKKTTKKSNKETEA